MNEAPIVSGRRLRLLARGLFLPFITKRHRPNAHAQNTEVRTCTVRGFVALFDAHLNVPLGRRYHARYEAGNTTALAIPSCDV